MFVLYPTTSGFATGQIKLVLLVVCERTSLFTAKTSRQSLRSHHKFVSECCSTMSQRLQTNKTAYGEVGFEMYLFVGQLNCCLLYRKVNLQFYLLVHWTRR